MTPTNSRRRAPAMDPERRRAMIVQSALPLVAEYGGTVTTGQIARAAGIGEGTIFRAFADKSELLGACLAEALDPEPVLAQLADIPVDQPLDRRLVEAADAVLATLARAGRVVDALQATGGGRRSGDGGAGADRRASHDRIAAALAGLFEPEAALLRLPADRLGRLFHALLLTDARFHDADEHRITAEEWVRVFLHGALTTPEEDPK